MRQFTESGKKAIMFSRMMKKAEQDAARIAQERKQKREEKRGKNKK